MNVSAEGLVSTDLAVRADDARKRIASWTLTFPMVGTAIVVINVLVQIFGNRERPSLLEVTSAIVQVWGFYGPYILAVLAYLHATGRQPTISELAPNGWQMHVLAHSYTMKIILLIFTIPLVIYAITLNFEVANQVMSAYLAGVHTVAGAAITYFFGRPQRKEV